MTIVLHLQHLIQTVILMKKFVLHVILEHMKYIAEMNQLQLLILPLLVDTMDIQHLLVNGIVAVTHLLQELLVLDIQIVLCVMELPELRCGAHTPAYHLT